MEKFDLKLKPTTIENIRKVAREQYGDNVSLTARLALEKAFPDEDNKMLKEDYQTKDA